MSDREKFLEEKISYLEPEETELEGRGKEFEINAPVTGAVTIHEAVVAGFGDGTVRFFKPDEKPKVINAHKGVVLCIATDGTEVFTGGDDGRFLKISPDGTIIEIAKQLEIDKLVYQSVENLRKSIISDSPIEDLEMSCFTGSYVTGTVNQEYLNWVENEYKS